MPKVTINLAGPVRVTGAGGRDITPASMKARGLIALLSVTAGLRLGRARLQDKLWSDRGAEQGSASLRQAMTEIRRRFGDDREALITGPGWVGLDPDCVTVVLDPAPGIAIETVEFAEDLEIHDPEFEDWLLIQRQHFAGLWAARGPLAIAPAPVTDQPVLIMPPAQTGRKDLDGFVDVALRDGATRAADLFYFDIFTDPAALTDHPTALMVLVHAVGPSTGGVTLNLSLVRGASGKQVVSRTFAIAPDHLLEGLKQVSAEVTLTLIHALAAEAATLPVINIFSYSRERLTAADAWFAARPRHPNALALRAYIRNTLILERLTDDPVTARAEATDMANEAIELAPHSATALAIGAMIATRNRRFELSADLADRATRIDPANPLTRHALSAALTFLGRHESAHEEAMRLVREPLRVLNPGAWPMVCAATAVRAGRYDEAMRYATLAHDYMPNYRPPLRFLGALHFHLGNDAGAAEALSKLRAIEPDFSLELMASNDYPVATLRAANLLGVARSQLM